PLTLKEEWVTEIEKEVTELPEARKKRFVQSHHLPDYDATVLTSEKDLANYFEEAVKHFKKPKLVSNWILTELLGLLHSKNLKIRQSPVSPVYLTELLQLIEDGKISGKMGKDILVKVFQTGKSPMSIVKEEKLTQISEPDELLKVIREVIKENPETISDYKKGKKKALGFLVGAVMRKTKGKANPMSVNKLLEKELL
ncbi:MAG: Asp-tRNA(Asn)/Glu-tRNA(Gln) amidotransferase GatCAB subunit B, partial [Candidatus Omnitrophica bacterium]|nr:Asp-tRNA(Asn)/Glu-tRNA(Gln) amidotransferase GatCAB subunit B [Candidatus Omnitrophota bacterium]